MSDNGSTEEGSDAETESGNESEIDAAVGNMLTDRFTDDDNKDEDEDEEEETEVDVGGSSGASSRDKPDVEVQDSGSDDDDDESDSTDQDDDDDDEIPVREWDQYSMLLPPSVADELNDWFRKINANRVLAEEPELAKNKHYNLAIARYVIDTMTEADILNYAGIDNSNDTSEEN